MDVIRLEGRAKGTSIVFLVAQESARVGRGRASVCEGGYQVAQNLRGWGSSRAHTLEYITCWGNLSSDLRN